MQKCAKAKSPSSAGRKTGRRVEYRVIADLPDPLPVTEAELDLLTSELADFLEELLGT
jgi:hypothetical protein